MENMEYIEQYKIMHSINKNYGASGGAYLREVSLIIDYLHPEIVLDYGCGKGMLISLLKEKYPLIEFRGYDPAVERYNVLSVKKADLVICTDVLEHVPEDELPKVIDKIACISDKVFFVLHHAKAQAILPNGENAHCTVKPHEWYKNVMLKYFANIISLQGREPELSVICTFILPVDIKRKYEFFMNYICDIDDFCQTLSNNESVVIYGAKNVCWVILGYLSRVHRWMLEKIKLIVVKDLDGNPEMIYGIPVVELKSESISKEKLFIIATTDRYHQEIKLDLESLGYYNVKAIDKEVLRQICFLYPPHRNEEEIIEYIISNKKQAKKTGRITVEPILAQHWLTGYCHDMDAIDEKK